MVEKEVEGIAREGGKKDRVKEREKEGGEREIVGKTQNEVNSL